MFSQKNFEGIIIYRTQKHGINSDMTYYFGKSKIKIVAKVSYSDSLYDFNQTGGSIYDFNKGTTISYNSFTERYKVDSLQEENQHDKVAVKRRNDSSNTIHGITCNELFFSVDTMGKSDISKSYTWYSSELRYIVPEKYKKILTPFTDGNMLWLEAIQITSYYHPLKQSQIIDTIETKAISIQKRKLKNSHFSIPRNYKLDDGSPTWDDISHQYQKSLKSPPKKSIKQKSGNN
jgi:hypothetical protein